MTESNSPSCPKIANKGSSAFSELELQNLKMSHQIHDLVNSQKEMLEFMKSSKVIFF